MYLTKMYNLRLFFIGLFLTFIFNYSLADIIKPNISIEPIQVVKIQLKSLQNNDKPTKDNGIDQTWLFAHPNNQRYTGPIEKFKDMLKSDSFSMLLNHVQHEIREVYRSDNTATYEVIILDQNKKYFKFKWQVEKYLQEGLLKNCWLTTAVSQPVDMGSSI